MIIHDFYYDNEPYYVENNKEYGKFKALYKLQKLDDLNYEKIVVGKNKLKLISDNDIVIIHNLDLYMKSKDLQRCLEYNYPLIKKELKKMHKRKPLSNKSISAKKVVVGSMALCMLLAAYKSKHLKLINTNESELKLSPNIEKNNDTIIEKIEDMIKDDIEQNNPTLSITFDNLSDSEKALYVQKTYGDLIKQYSTKWGIDPKLITAILTQESGGKEDNLMQIEYDAWYNQVISVKNFNDNSNVKIVLTDNPDLYDSSILTISKDDLNNPKTNISVGTIILNYNLKYYSYNIPIALTSYNCGTGTMNKILKETCINTGYTKEEIINDPTNLEFLNYRYIMTDGDENYFENVIRYIPDHENEEIRVFDNNNEMHILNFAFKSKTK